PAAAQDVRVTVTDVEARPGHLLGALYTRDNFLQGRGAYSVSMAAPAQPGTVVMVFHNVAPGSYAFSAFHDQNDDHQMQKAPHALPQEGRAFTRTLTAPPSFNALSFDVAAAAPTTLTVHMFYPYVPANH